MAITPAGSLVFFSCSLFMASLFAYSASVQFNDPDWYFWFPLYASASVVNLLGICFILKPRNQIAKFALGVGVFLFLKVVKEGSKSHEKEEREVWKLCSIGDGVAGSCMFWALLILLCSIKGDVTPWHNGWLSL
ncbi:hypothetical protein MRB53_029573 [Persea americana]|uniref:Uncharacterized protein n=1 Tax=Persea americana TaxID=3435 RepID=A0ACC2KJA7_PERAE|nr:hypothetical protein MRB53_029573 [Persea americana]